jgi:hypothetical protein
MVMMTKDTFKKSFEGYQIEDVSVRSKTIFYFLCRNKKEAAKASAVSEGDVTKRFTACAIKDGKANAAHWEFEGYVRLIVSATKIPQEKGVCISHDGKVFLSGGGQYDREVIPEDKSGPLRGIIIRARMIQGIVYAVGSGRSVYRKRGSNDWESLCLNLPLPTQAEEDNLDKSEDMTFGDIDGFSHNDLYAIAGRGVIWHFDGKAWQRIKFPSDILLEAICCAGDGYVYIGAQAGALFRGRSDQWEMIHSGGMSSPFKDIVWHANQLWCTNDYALWTVADGKLQEIEELPSEIKVCAGNLSAADGVMLMGGAHGAAYHDGTTWHVIFNQYQMEQGLEKK